MGNRKLYAGILAGAAVGAAAGILFAPRRGAETRETIGRKSRESVDGIRSRVTQMVETVSNKIHQPKTMKASAPQPVNAAAQAGAGKVPQRKSAARNLPGHQRNSPEAM